MTFGNSGFGSNTATTQDWLLASRNVRSTTTLEEPLAQASLAYWAASRIAEALGSSIEVEGQVEQSVQQIAAGAYETFQTGTEFRERIRRLRC